MAELPKSAEDDMIHCKGWEKNPINDGCEPTKLLVLIDPTYELARRGKLIKANA